MKSVFILALLMFLSSHFHVTAQGNGNRIPRIVGQDPLSTREDERITVQMTHLNVIDPDDWFYPWGFSMQLYPGNNYSLQGNTVLPAKDFYGELQVPVTVNDGSDNSERYNLKITVEPVNDKPVVTGHTALSLNENQSITLELSHFTVSDPDSEYPKDFTLKIAGGNNYSAQGTTLSPQQGFSGTLQVNVRVNDGQTDSDVYSLPVTVKKVDRVPQITGQTALQLNEDTSLQLQLNHLTVADEDSSYPSGFSLKILPGAHYSVESTTLVPEPDYFGYLTVPVVVNDGQNDSKPFNLSVAVAPVEDPPAILELETEPAFMGAGVGSVVISDQLQVAEVDGDSIHFAEVGIRIDAYHVTADELVFTPPQGSPIQGSFDVNTGVLTLQGQASPERYTAALRHVHYKSLLPATGLNKTIYIVVNDGKANSQTVERRILTGQASVSLDIPTAFTPNGDLSNDTWKIVPLKSEESYSSARIRIYNKQGILVFESVGFDNEWDGRHHGELLPADTYFYTIDLNFNSPEGYLRGPVTILR